MQLVLRYTLPKRAWTRYLPDLKLRYPKYSQISYVCHWVLSSGYGDGSLLIGEV